VPVVVVPFASEVIVSSCEEVIGPPSLAGNGYWATWQRRQALYREIPGALA